MVELHGWATIREGYTADCEEEKTGDIVSLLSQEVSRIGLDEPLLHIVQNNGEAFLTVTRLTNHFSGVVQEILDLFMRIAVIAPGSYGLLYLHDDEDGNGWMNDFQVYVLAKGVVTKRRDPFLSPCIPTVEDPWPDDAPEN